MFAAKKLQGAGGVGIPPLGIIDKTGFSSSYLYSSSLVIYARNYGCKRLGAFTAPGASTTSNAFDIFDIETGVDVGGSMAYATYPIHDTDISGNGYGFHTGSTGTYTDARWQRSSNAGSTWSNGGLDTGPYRYSFGKAGDTYSWMYQESNSTSICGILKVTNPSSVSLVYNQGPGFGPPQGFRGATADGSYAFLQIDSTTYRRFAGAGGYNTFSTSNFVDYSNVRGCFYDTDTFYFIYTNGSSNAIRTVPNSQSSGNFNTYSGEKNLPSGVTATGWRTSQIGNTWILYYGREYYVSIDKGVNWRYLNTTGLVEHVSSSPLGWDKSYYICSGETRLFYGTSSTGGQRVHFSDELFS